MEKYMHELRPFGGAPPQPSATENVPIKSFTTWFHIKTLPDIEDRLPTVIQGAPEVVANWMVNDIKQQIKKLESRYLGCSKVTITVYKLNEIRKVNAAQAPDKLFEGTICESLAIRTVCLRFDLFAFD